MPSRVSDGWQISGITTFQSGFPLDVVDSALPSLTDSFFQFYCTPGFACWDVPNVTGPIVYENPKTNGTNQWVSESAFPAPALGTQGNAGRNILRGPGLNNWDFSIMKDTSFTEGTRLEVRFEFFNIFNHTQFDPAGINTDINSSSFGQELFGFMTRDTDSNSGEVLLLGQQRNRRAFLDNEDLHEGRPARAATAFVLIYSGTIAYARSAPWRSAGVAKAEALSPVTS